MSDTSFVPLDKSLKVGDIVYQKDGMVKYKVTSLTGLGRNSITVASVKNPEEEFFVQKDNFVKSSTDNPTEDDIPSRAGRRYRRKSKRTRRHSKTKK